MFKERTIILYFGRSTGVQYHVSFDWSPTRLDANARWEWEAAGCGALSLCGRSPDGGKCVWDSTHTVTDTHLPVAVEMQVLFFWPFSNSHGWMQLQLATHQEHVIPGGPYASRVHDSLICLRMRHSNECCTSNLNSNNCIIRTMLYNESMQAPHVTGSEFPPDRHSNLNC